MKTTTFSGGPRDGSSDGGGINLPMFAKDGETLYLGQQSTLAFSLSVQMARP